MSRRSVRVGVVGVGYLGRFHAEKYAGMEGVELVGVLDLDRSRAEEAARACGTEVFEDLEELARRIDAASVVVPTVAHAEVALALIREGVHVLVEKPLAASLEEADRIVEAAREKGVVLQVGHLERFNPAILYLEEHCENPLFIEAHRLSGFKDRSTDVDVVLDLMIHDIEIALALIQAPVSEIRAVGVPVLTPRVDIANARIIFESGANANLTASRISLQPMRRVRVFQPGLYLSADCAKQENLKVRRDPSRPAMEGIVPEFTRHGRKDILFEELRAFVDSVRTGKRPKVTGEAAREALRVAQAVREEIESGLSRFGSRIGLG